MVASNETVEDIIQEISTAPPKEKKLKLEPNEVVQLSVETESNSSKKKIKRKGSSGVVNIKTIKRKRTEKATDPLDIKQYSIKTWND